MYDKLSKSSSTNVSSNAIVSSSEGLTKCVELESSNVGPSWAEEARSTIDSLISGSSSDSPVYKNSVVSVRAIKES